MRDVHTAEINKVKEGWSDELFAMRVDEIHNNYNNAVTENEGGKDIKYTTIPQTDFESDEEYSQFIRAIMEQRNLNILEKVNEQIAGEEKALKAWG